MRSYLRIVTMPLINALYEEWMRKGLVGVVWGTVEINSATLPIECQRELYSFIKKPIERSIKKANKQIKQTKADFNLRHASGLLFLANDGNYSLESAHLIDIACKILSNQYSGIDGFVYLTVNMRAMKPGYERDVNVWVPKYRNHNAPLIKWATKWLKLGVGSTRRRLVKMCQHISWKLMTRKR